MRSQPAQVLQVLGLGIAQNATGYMVLTYIGIHLVREGGYSQTAVTWTAGLLTAATLATWLIDRTGNSLSPAYFLIGSSAIGLLTLLTIRRKRRGLGEAGDAADDTPAVPART
ncbi:hypothetical protein [Gordonia sp. NPDC127522]|uniref:hypothetical protein n=1 Tax=Gordonia sp. NPDC127522 TaxID=3345390 RepID=UPI003642F98A